MEGIKHFVDVLAYPYWSFTLSIIAFFLILGFYPKLALDVINPAVAASLSHVQSDAAITPAAEGSTK